MPDRTCSIAECESRQYQRGWCSKHYTRYIRNGHPLALRQVPPNASMEARLRFVGWTEVVRKPDLGPCWEWNGRTTADGYGWSTQPGPSKNILAHRAAYILWVGPIPSGRVLARHSCDNPPCINPAHLLLGTDADNSDDKISRKRQANGERSGSAKLTDVQVDEIRARHAAGGVTQTALAREFGISSTHISNLINRLKRKTPTNTIL